MAEDEMVDACGGHVGNRLMRTASPALRVDILVCPCMGLISST
jgi:hypothetical protein